jgi:hypothetical protein
MRFYSLRGGAKMRQGSGRRVVRCRFGVKVRRGVQKSLGYGSMKGGDCEGGLARRGSKNKCGIIGRSPVGREGNGGRWWDGLYQSIYLCRCRTLGNAEFVPATEFASRRPLANANYGNI